MLWCIAKYAIIRETKDPNSKILGKVPFGVMCTSNHRKLEGNIRIMYRLPDRNRTRITGYVNSRAFTYDPVISNAGLYYYNGLNKRIPYSKRFRDAKVVGYIYPGQRVKVYYKIDSWCLTSVGWTKFAWLTKDRDIFDAESANNLLYAVLTQAVHDYSNDVKRLKNRKYHDLQEYCDLVNDLEKILNWFLDRPRVLKSDYVTVRERLEDLNEKLGIDDKWLARKKRVRNVLYRKNFARKKKDKDE